jgi:hypothetical protein
LKNGEKKEEKKEKRGIGVLPAWCIVGVSFAFGLEYLGFRQYLTLEYRAFWTLRLLVDRRRHGKALRGFEFGCLNG